jgi:hypothetical protein
MNAITEEFGRQLGVHIGTLVLHFVEGFVTPFASGVQQAGAASSHTGESLQKQPRSKARRALAAVSSMTAVAGGIAAMCHRLWHKRVSTAPAKPADTAQADGTSTSAAGGNAALGLAGSEGDAVTSIAVDGGTPAVGLLAHNSAGSNASAAAYDLAAKVAGITAEAGATALKATQNKNLSLLRRNSNVSSSGCSSTTSSGRQTPAAGAAQPYQEQHQQSQQLQQQQPQQPQQQEQQQEQQEQEQQQEQRQEQHQLQQQLPNQMLVTYAGHGPTVIRVGSLSVTVVPKPTASSRHISVSLHFNWPLRSGDGQEPKLVHTLQLAGASSFIGVFSSPEEDYRKLYIGVELQHKVAAELVVHEGFWVDWERQTNGTKEFDLIWPGSLGP